MMFSTVTLPCLSRIEMFCIITRPLSGLYEVLVVTVFPSRWRAVLVVPSHLAELAVSLRHKNFHPIVLPAAPLDQAQKECWLPGRTYTSGVRSVAQTNRQVYITG
jgi:hypothetical protein